MNTDNHPTEPTECNMQNEEGEVCRQRLIFPLQIERSSTSAAATV